MQANAAVANAYVADISAPEERAKRFGMLGAMFGIGFILGPRWAACSARSTAPAVLRRRRSGAGQPPVRLLRAARIAAGDRRRPFTWKSAHPVKALKALSQLKGVGRLVGVIDAPGWRRACSTTAGCSTTPSVRLGRQRERLVAGRNRRGLGVRPGWLLGKLLKKLPPQRLAVFGLVSSMVAYALWGAARLAG